MKPQSLHAQEDRLLDFVYGELPPTEAHAVESHLEGCTRCSELLADIRGVRTTMAQLPMEPAPDAGLESLLAYAQQAARNAAAGPAPKPTWWRRWLVPAIGVAAVCFFGIISIQVSKSVDLRPELAAKSEPARRDVAATESVQGQPREPMAPEPVAQAAPAPAPTTPEANAAPAQTEAPAAAMATTPPTSYPAAKLDDSVMKEAPRKKAYTSESKVARADYSNAGAGPRFERGKAAKNDELAAVEKKSADKMLKDEEYNQRDAMTQVGAISKTKGLMVGSTQGDSYQQQALPAPSPKPAPAAAQPAEEVAPGGADGALAEADAPQQEAYRGSSLRLGGGSSTGAGAANKPAADSRAEDLDDLVASKTVVAEREQRQQSRTAMPSPPPPASAAAPRPAMPSMGMSTAAPSASMSRAEAKGRAAGSSSSELSKQAQEAFRSGNRVLEAQLLTQALNAGATGSERLGLLNRLCDAQFAIGQREAAVQTCNQVLELGPRSGAAQMAQRRLSREAPEADDAKVLPGARASKKAAPADTERAAPASMPAQAQ
jgi:hypothetical protein